jgi:hypothetical protein
MDSGFSTLASGLMGIRRGLDGLAREARAIAHASVGGSPEDLAAAAVRIAEQKLLVEANAAAVRRASDATGKLIDILA